MSQHAIASLFVIAYLGLSSAPHHAVTVKPDPSSTASVSFVMNSPILAQQSPTAWQTTVLVDSTPSCLPTVLKYQLVTIPAAAPIDGKVISTVPVQPAGKPEVGCSNAIGGQDYEITVKFPLSVPFSTVPTSATIVVDKPGGDVASTAIPLTVHRLVTRWQYVWAPIICGAIMALLFVTLVWGVPGFRAFSRDDPSIHAFSFRRFWTRPLYATAAWTFKDSWATNIAAAGTVIAGILTATGTVSTLLPGVQLDRYAVLVAICGAIIVAAPLVFGVVNAVCYGNHPAVIPDDAIITPPDNGQDRDFRIMVAAGASITFPGGAKRNVNDQQPDLLSSGASVSVPADSLITVSGQPIAVATSTATVIAVRAESTITVTKDLTIAPGAIVGQVPANPPANQAAGPVTAGTPIIVPAAGAAVTVTGVADIELPEGTSITALGAARIKLPSVTHFKAPSGTNVIMADMRSVILAAVVTLFGIGAELGIVGILAGYLSAEALQARVIAVLVVAIMAVVTLWYAAATTRVLADSPRGSALNGDETSYTL